MPRPGVPGFALPQEQLSLCLFHGSVAFQALCGKEGQAECNDAFSPTLPLRLRWILQDRKFQQLLVQLLQERLDRP